MVDWMAVGLGLNFIGALFFGVKGTRFVKYPIVGRVANAKFKVLALERLLADQQLESEMDEFTHLLTIIEKKTNLEVPDGATEIRITDRTEAEAGTVVTITTDDEMTREVIGEPNLVRSWVESEVQDWYFKIGVTFLAGGFALQFATRLLG